MQAYRQGDVSIIVVEGIPKNTKRVRGEPILACGEVTGYAHRMVEGKVRSTSSQGFFTYGYSPLCQFK